MNKCIAIDGPSGTGKSTVAKELSKQLAMVYVDTGAMYRALGYSLNKLGVNLDSQHDVESSMTKVSLELKYLDNAQHIFANGEDVTSTIRTQEVSTFASKVAVYRGVREMLVNMQKQLVEKNDVVMDGRDIGTKVMPNARFKFYLDASAEERTKRRINELNEKGIDSDYKIIFDEIVERDERDKNRKESPLVKANDAVYIDTSDIDINGVISLIKSYLDK